MSLLCTLGWHAIDPLARWNAGYYFGTCNRCGVDLVRTAYGPWHVPAGHRIVWQATPPQAAENPALVPDAQMELPIAEVLDALAQDPPEVSVEEELVLDEPLLETLPEPTPAPPPRRGAIPDFMDERHAGPIPSAPSAPYFLGDAPAGPDAAPARTGFRLPAFLTAPPLPREAPPPRTAGPRRPPRKPRAPRKPLRFGGHMAEAGAALFGIALIAAALVWGPDVAPGDIFAEPNRVAIGPGATLETGFVTASLLNCRAAPVAQGRTVRRLNRGDAVQVLARDSDWLSIAHDGGQCWASARFIAPTMPL